MRLRAPRSLLGQIGLVHLVTIVVAALALPLAATLTLHRTAARYQREQLTRQAAEVRAGLQHDAQGWHVRLDPVLAALYAGGREGRAFLLVDERARPRIASAYATGAILARASLRPHPHGFALGPIRGLAVPVAVGGAGGWLIVSQDLSDPGVVTDDVVRAFLARFLWLLLPILAFLPIANLLLIRRSTQAVRDLSARAAGIGPTTLDRRLPTAALPSEVAPLAIATNNAFDRLERGFRAQSEFVANVAHELRTPLATLRLKLDGVADPSVAASMRRTLDEASHVIAQLLDLASLERLAIAADERFDLAAMAQSVIEELAPGIYAGGRTIGLVAPDEPRFVRGRAPLIALALTNLLDNARRHTPPGTRIEVRVEDAGALIVEDDGPGLAERDPGALAARFRRGEGAHVEGSGIGLSIVGRILGAHESALDIGAAARGARFSFTLPRA